MAVWFADWGTHEIIVVDDDGKSECVLRLQFSSFQPISIDWLRDGSSSFLRSMTLFYAESSMEAWSRTRT